MDLAVKILYMLALLGAGFGARRVGVLTAGRADSLTTFAFYVALPALVFDSTAATALEDVLSVAMVAAFLVVLLGVAGIGWLVHRRVPTRAARSVAIVQSYHTNFGFLGLPIVAMTLGSAATAKAGILLGIGALIQIPMTVVLLTSMNDADASLRDELAGVARNPVIAALLLGLGFAAFGVPVPGPASTALGWVSTLALPAALLSVGASLTLSLDGVDVSTVGSVVALKVLLMPLLGLAALSLLTSDIATVQAGSVMLAMPTAVSTFIYANELGGDARLASTNVFVTTVCSLGAVFVILRLLV
ncbi:AEC family transporter (plasmid) [Halarchaeum sp. CBA1220]|uniref:AEC family transporter n=1 Tax=Halarchaeum sp. CBA1220 TaxID=1853682 RepID=UPI000F3A93F9|nr:AEC family transporter [Halarchaeum sp. CBA1220]QLC34897.1 AEC family transporter [Halarchaeum sp. CBA1220]